MWLLNRCSNLIMSSQEIEALHWLSAKLARMLGFEDPSAAVDMADYV